MTHSHDRTLLANLAFGDPDKKNAEHSLACRYLAQDAQRDALIELVGLEIKERSNHYGDSSSGTKKSSPSARLEYAINKGEGQYRTTIGFVDVAIVLGSHTLAEMKFGRPNYTQTSIGIGVEVKIGAVPVDELLRQINLYKQYLSWFEWVAALRFNVDQSYIDTLEQQNIRVVRLGEKFTEWLASSQIERVPARVREI